MSKSNQRKVTLYLESKDWRNLASVLRIISNEVKNRGDLASPSDKEMQLSTQNLLHQLRDRYGIG